MRDTVAHAQDAVKPVLERNAPRALRPGGIKSCSPDDSLAAAVRKMNPEAKCQIRDKVTARKPLGKPVHGNVDDLPIDAVDVHRALA